MDRKEVNELIGIAFGVGFVIGLIMTVILATLIRNLTVDAQAAETGITVEYIDIEEGPESAQPAPPVLECLGEFQLTYYCPGRCCNGENAGIDCFGGKLKWGTVAVDPKVIPLKTHLVIDGYDAEFVARDTGGKFVQGKHIDIFVPVSHTEAKEMNDKKSKAMVWRVVE